MNIILSSLLCILMVLFPLPALAGKGEAMLSVPERLPGDSFYWVTRFMEGVGDMFTLGKMHRTLRALTLSSRRLGEVDGLLNREGINVSELVPEVLQRYESALEEILSLLETLQRSKSTSPDVLAHVLPVLLIHIEAFDRLEPKTLQPVKEDLLHARTATWDGMVKILRGWSAQYPIPVLQQVASLFSKRLSVLDGKSNEKQGVTQRVLGEVMVLQGLLEEVGRSPQREEVARVAAQKIVGIFTVLQGALDRTQGGVREGLQKTRRAIFPSVRTVLRQWQTTTPAAAVKVYTDFLDLVLSGVLEGRSYALRVQNLLILGDAFPFVQEMLQGVQGSDVSVIAEMLLKTLTNHVIKLSMLSEESLPGVKSDLIRSLVAAEVSRERVWEVLKKLGLREGEVGDLLSNSSLGGEVHAEVDALFGKRPSEVQQYPSAHTIEEGIFPLENVFPIPVIPPQALRERAGNFSSVPRSPVEDKILFKDFPALPEFPVEQSENEGLRSPLLDPPNFSNLLKGRQGLSDLPREWGVGVNGGDTSIKPPVFDFKQPSLPGIILPGGGVVTPGIPLSSQGVDVLLRQIR